MHRLKKNTKTVQHLKPLKHQKKKILKNHPKLLPLNNEHTQEILIKIQEVKRLD